MSVEPRISGWRGVRRPDTPRNTRRRSVIRGDGSTCITHCDPLTGAAPDASTPDPRETLQSAVIAR